MHAVNVFLVFHISNITRSEILQNAHLTRILSTPLYFFFHIVICRTYQCSCEENINVHVYNSNDSAQDIEKRLK